ncbi:protein of unknown function [Tenacibaculum sp. 190524A02b]|uniref:lipase family alpha/beta hydrolase n=1 Tax=Tenacibaculum vairaonense TaxID=3137860 RepID=UPI0032B2342A
MSLKEHSKPITPENRTRAIVFVHGLFGGVKSWYDEKNPHRIINRLLCDDEISNHYRLYTFSYHTKKLKVNKFGHVLTTILPVYRRGFNNNIRQVSNSLLTYLQELELEHETIIIVGHSMGGLVSKKALVIMGELRKKVPIYFSLSVPHLGAQLPNNIFIRFFNLLLGNPQIRNLALFGEFITSLNSDFASLKIPPPYCIYQAGNFDRVVNENSAIPHGINKENGFVTDNTHFSILTPEKDNHPLLTRLKRELKILVTQHTTKDWVLKNVQIYVPDNIIKEKNNSFKAISEWVLNNHYDILIQKEYLNENERGRIIFDEDKFTTEVLETPINVKGEIKGSNIYQVLMNLRNYDRTETLPYYNVEIIGNNYHLV